MGRDRAQDTPHEQVSFCVRVKLSRSQMDAIDRRGGVGGFERGGACDPSNLSSQGHISGNPVVVGGACVLTGE